MANSDDDALGLTPRRMERDEIEALLALDVPAHLATIDRRGIPVVVPIWFLWDGDAFLMSSVRSRPHVARLLRNPVASVCVDIEGPERDDGQRPNKQVRATGRASVAADVGGAVTRRITYKYLRGPGAEERANDRASHDRVIVRLQPESVVAIASV